MKAILACILASLCLGAGLGVVLGYVEARPWQMRRGADVESLTGNVSTGDVSTGNVSTGNQVAEGHRGASTEQQDPAAATSTTAASPSSANVEGGTPRPKARIDSTVYNFERMERGASMHHGFVVHNDGNVPLLLTFVSHTCKCTRVTLNGVDVEARDGDKVPPGGEAVIDLEWTAKTATGPFRHGATFATSDPELARLELTVEGDVVDSSTLFPSQLDFSRARIGETSEESTTVTSYLEPEVRIVSHRLVGFPEDIARRLTVRVEQVPMSPTEPSAHDRDHEGGHDHEGAHDHEGPHDHDHEAGYAAGHEGANDGAPDAKAAARVVVALEAGGMIGPFQGELQLETNLKGAEKLTVPVSGTIKGDLSIVGEMWNSRSGLLQFRTVKSSDGARARLNLMIRGKHAKATKVEVARRVPEVLQAILGDPQPRGEEFVQIPLTVEIPPGTPPFVLAGDGSDVTSADKSAVSVHEGEIILSTTHPDAPEIRLRVHVAVVP